MTALCASISVRRSGTVHLPREKTACASGAAAAAAASLAATLHHPHPSSDQRAQQ